MTDEAFTDEELGNLTEEEALALKDDSDEGADLQAGAEDVSDDVTETTDDEGGDEQLASESAAQESGEGQDETPEPEYAVEADGKTLEADGDDGQESASADAVTEDAAPADKEQPVQEQAAQTDGDAQTPQDRLAAINAELDGLGELLEEGEIDFKQYNAKVVSLNDAKQDLKIEIREQANAQRQRAENWKTAVDNFIAADAGHKKVVDSPIIKQAFETALREVAATPEGQRQTDAWRLDKAKQLLADNGINIGTPAKAAEPVNKAQPKSRQPDVKIPRTLGDVPKAGANDQNEFAHLNGLDGLDLEAALAKMTPDQEARYLDS